MQIFEALFLLAVATILVRLVAGPFHRFFRYSALASGAVALLCLGGIFEGWRWQMWPAYLAFAVLLLAMVKKSNTRQIWRALGAVPLTALTGLSAALAHYVPVVSLPAPTGPYAVGTFNYVATDMARRERFAPDRNRELFVEVWYPADRQLSRNIPVRTLFQDLYEGEFNKHNVLFGYLKNVDTHSRIQAPVAKSSEEKFPVLLFNHGWGGGFTSQNQLLMEHLASHGYVVFSIGHTYQSAKVNLGRTGTIYRTESLPGDLVLPERTVESGIVGKVYEATQDMTSVSDLKALLYPLAENYVAVPDAEKATFLQQALRSTGFNPFRTLLTDALVLDFIQYEYIKENSMVEYWVQDNQFIADTLPALEAPIAGLSAALDTQRLGVIGMSYGGAVAGEFCKIDARCKAGVNIDGTQWGRHWNVPLQAPFLMLYHDGHEGGNDFAYPQSAHDYRDYKIKNSGHTDFTDFAYALPILKPMGIAGKIDGMRMMEILNSAQQGFFDHYLKDEPIADELYTRFPEIVVRKNGSKAP